jgi:endoglucanase
MLFAQNEQTFRVTAGTNIAHWLSQSNQRGEVRKAFFSEKDVATIQSLGFDHIRLPIDEEQMWKEDGSREAEAFGLLQQCLTWCQAHNLRVIVDLHILRSHHFNNEVKPLWTDPKEQTKFIALWKDLSKSLKPWPNQMVAYELMNEPVADDHEEWNRLLARVVDSVRAWEPKRTLVIGSNRWQSADTFDALRVPENDPNILLSYHFYEPFTLTHYQASWTDLKDMKEPVQYPGQIVVGGTTPEGRRVYDREKLVAMMQKPIALSRKLGLPLYCGEFGAIYKAPYDSRVAWYKDMVSIFKEYGIGYANWNYKAGSFGVVDTQGKPDEVLTSILTR